MFMASPPEILNELFLEKQKKLEEERKDVNEIISTLKKEYSTEQPYSNYKYYEGITGVKSMWHELNELMDSKTVNKYYTARKEGYKNLLGFYTEHHKIRKEKKVRAKMIFPIEDKELAKKRTNEITNIRFAKLDNDVEWGIVKDEFYIHYITGKVPRGFLIKDEVFAKTFSKVFDQLWEKSEK